jgi:hypothetical protein
VPNASAGMVGSFSWLLLPAVSAGASPWPLLPAWLVPQVLPLNDESWLVLI